MTATPNASTIFDRNRCVASRRRCGALLTVLLCLLATGCAKLARDFGEISKLHAAIVKEFGEKEVGVNLNNDTILTVSFINSPLNDKAPEDRAQRAEKTAAFVKDHFQLISRVSKIWVVFVRAKTYFIFLHTAETISVFGFDKDGKALTFSDERRASSAPDLSLKPSAVYSPDLRQTDVMLNGMQLRGHYNQGMTMSVYYSVRGDATGLRRADAPESVQVDLASYSEKSLFPGQPKIQLVADGKVAFQTTAQFSTSKNASGLFSELATIAVPYRAFSRAIAGEELTLNVGGREYALTDEQLEALRGITQYVEE